MVVLVLEIIDTVSDEPHPASTAFTFFNFTLYHDHDQHFFITSILPNNAAPKISMFMFHSASHCLVHSAK
jgi:hypothetical protein